jgi:acyl-CoA reductase-like NAD-dependent aldehyde dehydrogenase
MLKTISPIDNSLYSEIPYASDSTIENTLTSSHKAKTTWKNTRFTRKKKINCKVCGLFFI